jgi:LacI family transcriptional regulator
VDDTQAAHDAVNHLILSGCRRIALISTTDDLSVGRLRTQGYLKALKLAGIEVEKQLIIKIGDNELSEQLISELFAKNKFDGVFAVNEFFAVTAMKVARNRGLKIPEDVAFVGFTDGILSRTATPPLTTIAQHGMAMGEAAARMLIDRLEKEQKDEAYYTQIIQTSLIERESTKKKS